MFHTAPLAGFNYSQSELELADHMVTYWPNFVHTGDPNGAQDNTQVRYQHTSHNSGRSRKGGVPLSRTFSTALVCMHEAGEACAQNDKKGGSTEPKEPPWIHHRIKCFAGFMLRQL